MRAVAVRRWLALAALLAVAYGCAPRPVPKTSAVSALPAVWINPRDGSEMVLIPAGRFRMGSATGSPYERPSHEVTLGDYYIGRHEVTNDQFARFLLESKAGRLGEYGLWRERAGPGRGRHPVVRVNWRDDVSAYCKWAGVRLPSEAEWEKAARGNDGRRFPWGDHFQASRCNGAPGGREDTAPVGSYPAGASPYGLLDMSGNVWEWCETSWDAYPDNDLDNPEFGLEEFRIVRGGSWTDTPTNLRTSARHWKLSFNGNTTTGFRVALSPPLPAHPAHPAHPAPADPREASPPAPAASAEPPAPPR